MKILFLLVSTLATVYSSDMSEHTAPKVQLYSRDPGEFGKGNVLICHVSGFHPPDIVIQVLKGGVELPNANQTDLAFGQNWRFHLTKSVAFIPSREEKYSCKVTHGQNIRNYSWDPNM